MGLAKDIRKGIKGLVNFLSDIDIDLSMSDSDTNSCYSVEKEKDSMGIFVNDGKSKSDISFKNKKLSVNVES